MSNQSGQPGGPAGDGDDGPPRAQPRDNQAGLDTAGPGRMDVASGRPEDRDGAAGAGSPTAGSVLPLYTPAQAARLLAVRESWLRRRATARGVPCTFLGKHLRFSHADLVAIAAAAAQPAGWPARPGRPARRRRPRR